MLNLLRKQKGFTLIQLVIVIGILGILAAIAVPRITNANNAAKRAKILADLRILDDSMQIYAIDTGIVIINSRGIAAFGPLVEAGYLTTVPRPGFGSVLSPDGKTTYKVNPKDYNVPADTAPGQHTAGKAAVQLNAVWYDTKGLKKLGW